MSIEPEQELYRETVGHFCEIAEARGHMITGLALRRLTDVASWIAPADAYLLRTTVTSTRTNSASRSSRGLMPEGGFFG